MVGELIMESQRRFAVMGTNLFKILSKLTHNQKLCRLLKYQSLNPFSDEYEDVDVNEAFTNLLNKLGGLNSILFEPPELVTVISLLERAMWTYNKPKFNFYKYRKLLLDAGSEVLKIKEV